MNRFIPILILSIIIIFGMASPSTAQEDAGDFTGASVVGFIYLMCNDIDEMRHFYTDILGMAEFDYMNEDELAYLGYASGGFNFMIFEGKDEIAEITDFTWQPGPSANSPVEGISWSIGVPESRWDEVIETLQSEGVRSSIDEPEFLFEFYWSYPVLDPMGNTVEVYTIPEEMPQ